MINYLFRRNSGYWRAIDRSRVLIMYIFIWTKEIGLSPLLYIVYNVALVIFGQLARTVSYLCITYIGQQFISVCCTFIAQSLRILCVQQYTTCA